MILYIIRHAWAGEPDDTQYPDDRLRPLTPEGRSRFRRVVRKLSERGFEPDILATSPLLRCRQTAEIISENLAHSPRIVELAALQPGSGLRELTRWTVEQQVGQVAWIGHAPDVERLAGELIGNDSAWLRFPKGAVAAIRFQHEFGVGQGELNWLVTAKVLNC